MRASFADFENREKTIGVVGLGYVGLPLASLLATRFRVFGYDIDASRVRDLENGIDRTHEVLEAQRIKHEHISYSTDPAHLEECSVIIVTVPTPVDDFNKPDLRPLLSASETVARFMRKGTVVVYESTVYPGCTENECRKVLEQVSALKYKVDFDLGYSPERVNPGDRQHSIDKIAKVVSGSSEETLELLSQLYGSVITAPIHKAPTLATAEAAKIIENVQRDLNIALMNELAQLFDRCGLNTQDVLTAARTKWNFLPFYPGLVGGHCIGVDPYYLTHMAEGLGFHAQIISAGRRVNHSMAEFLAQKTIKLLLQAGKIQGTPRIAVLGMTFKENISDLRNTKSMDLVQSLENFGASVYCVDPVCDPDEFERNFHRSLVSWEDLPTCDAIILATKHDVLVKELTLERLSQKLEASKLLIDVKGVYNRELATQMGIKIWSL